MTQEEKNITATWYDSEATVWVSKCPALGIYSQGESEEEADLAIKEAVALFLQVAALRQAEPPAGG